jgi:hypothetical protein
MFDFLSPGRKRAPDPLSSLKAVTHWMSDLPLGDVYATLDKVVKATIEFNDKKEPLTKERLDVLMHLDEHSQEMVVALSRQYLRNPRMSKAIESRLWNIIHAFYWEITRGYHAFIMDYVAHPAGSRIKASVPQITCRAMRYFACSFKWHYFRFEQIDEKAWRRLHNLYGFAEFEEFERETMELYSGERVSSCADEYLQALMLDLLNTGSLYPRQVEMVDGWLDGWSGLMNIDQRYDPDSHVFYVDLSKGRGAQRMRRPQEKETLRYWGTGKLVAHIEEIRAALLNGEVPARLGLGEDCRLPACLDFLDEVARQWAPVVPRVRRKHERKRAVKMIEVIHSMQAIFEQVTIDNDIAQKRKNGGASAELSYEEMVDVHLYGFVTKRTQMKLGAGGGTESGKAAVQHERWLMENESERGFGATVDEIGDDWLRLGKLVGLKPERRGHWVIAVVRRLNKVSNTQRYVGLEILANAPVAVTLRPKQQNLAGYVVESIDTVDVMLPVAGIYLNQDDEAGFPNSLIIDASEFSARRVFTLSALGKSYTIALKEVVDKGDEWLRVSFDVLAKNGERGK